MRQEKKKMAGNQEKTVCVVGLGYIGLPTALMLAAHGVRVIGTDYSERIVNELNEGRLTFLEPGLDELFEAALQKDITFVTTYPEADVYIIAVPTPYNKKSKRIDPSYVVTAASSVCDVAPRGSIIVVESTVSPGTIDACVRPIVESHGLSVGSDIHLAHAPERIIPGNMMYELENNNRTIGADSREIAEDIRDIYKSFCRGTISITDIRTAELSKVVENTYRDVNIAFANELVKICKAAGVNVHELIKIANMHPRVNILSPGPGVGGHCISVDPWFLVGDYPSIAKLVWQARLINDSMPEYVLSRIRELMNQFNVNDVSRVGLYGLTYKENVDDVRESPTLQLLECMDVHLGSKSIKVYDPYIVDDIVDGQLHDFKEFLDSVDLVVVMVAHSQIIESAERLAGKVVLDTRHCLSTIETHDL